uniref:Uncharacterized protein n=1 Tax=Rhipicephalus zambeziensis TaxID=60191 RepID=A0A224YH65_9ACAR
MLVHRSTSGTRFFLFRAFRFNTLAVLSFFLCISATIYAHVLRLAMQCTEMFFFFLLLVLCLCVLNVCTNTCVCTCFCAYVTLRLSQISFYSYYPFQSCEIGISWKRLVSLMLLLYITLIASSY